MNSLLLPPRFYGLTLLLGVILLVLTACTPATTPPASLSGESDPEPLPQVAASTDFVADWVSQVGGDAVTVVPILPEGADPHDYRPGPQDMVVLSQSDLIFQVGLGLEESWFNELIANIQEGGAEVIALGDYVDVIVFDPDEMAGDHGDGHADEDAHGHAEDHQDEGSHEGADADDHAHGHAEDHQDEESHEGADADDHAHGHAEDHQDEGSHGDAHGHEEGSGSIDSHFWLDPLRVKSVMPVIATHLAELNPAAAADFQERAAAYSAELDELHAWIEEQVATVPEEQRLLVSGHEFMRYFAERYHFEVIGSISGGTGTAHSHEVPVYDVTALVSRMRDRDIKAIFTEYGFENELAGRVAEEVGNVLVVPLYMGSVGPTGSYIDMIKTNVATLVEALQ